MISPTLSYRFAAEHSIGLSLNIAFQQFETYGLKVFSAYSQSPEAVSNRGVDNASGLGVRIGYLGHLGDRVSIGAFYQTKVWTNNFHKYAGLFAGQGGFDVPASWGGGIAFKATPALTLAADVKRIDYAGVPSVGDPLLPAPFGSTDGPGFGWRNITVFKLGASYVASPRWTLRVGYGHSDNPVPTTQTLLSVLAPGVVQSHLTAGATYTLPSGLEVTGFVLHALKNTVHGAINSIPSNFGGGQADISLSETSAGLSAGIKF